MVDRGNRNYTKAMAELDKYDRLNMLTNEDNELLNDCRESSTSNSDRGDLDDIDTSFWLLSH